MLHDRRLIPSLSLLATFLAGSAGAQTPGLPTAPPIAPILESINAETQAIYESIRPGVLRVQFPPPQWFSLNGDDTSELMKKWREKLDQATRDRLNAMQAAAAAGRDVGLDAVVSSEATTRSTTQPATRAVPLVLTRPDGGIEVIAPGSAPYDALVASLFPKVTALVVDDQGHAIIPVFVAKELIGDQPFMVTAADGSVQRAKLIGADRQTNITVIQLERPVGKPVKMLDEHPAEGSLAMLLPVGGEAGRLIVWTASQRESGVVVSLRGGISGFALYGRFLTGAACEPIVSQLIQYGRVRRATLGVLVVQDDSTGTRLIRIERVLPNSAAASAGLLADDVITAVSGAPVNDLPNFAAAIARSDGQTAVAILRGKQKMELKVELQPK